MAIWVTCDATTGCSESQGPKPPNRPKGSLLTAEMFHEQFRDVKHRGCPGSSQAFSFRWLLCADCSSGSSTPSAYKDGKTCTWTQNGNQLPDGARKCRGCIRRAGAARNTPLPPWGPPDRSVSAIAAASRCGWSHEGR